MHDLCAAVHPEQPVVKCTLPPHKADVHWSETFGILWNGQRPPFMRVDLSAVEYRPFVLLPTATSAAPVHVAPVTGTFTEVIRSGAFAKAAFEHGQEAVSVAPSDVDGELRDKIAAAIAEADGRYVGLEPLADASYPEMAEVALSVVREERYKLKHDRDWAREEIAWLREHSLSAKDAEIARLRAQLSETADQLASSNEHYDELEAEVERLTKERDEAVASRDLARSNWDKAREFNTKALDKFAAYERDRDEARRERASLSAFRTRAAHAALCLDAQEDDEIIAEIDKLREERDRLRELERRQPGDVHAELLAEIQRSEELSTLLRGMARRVRDYRQGADAEAHHADEVSAELWDLRKRAVILPDDWWRQLFDLLRFYHSRRGMPASHAVERIHGLIESWRAPTPAGPSQPRSNDEGGSVGADLCDGGYGCKAPEHIEGCLSGDVDAFKRAPRVFPLDSPEPVGVNKVRADTNGVIFERRTSPRRPSGSWYATMESGGDGEHYTWRAINASDSNHGGQSLTEVLAPSTQDGE